MNNNMMNTHVLRSSLEHSLLGYFQSDNMIINYIMTFMIISMIGSFIQKIDLLPGIISNYISRLYNFIYDLILKILRRNKTKKIIKKIVIEKITDERQVNPLYNAVAWYLMNQVNLDKEETLKCIIEQKITETTQSTPDIMRRVTQDIDRTLKFNGRDIRYKLSASRIKIDGEEGDRRNDLIECSTEVDKDDDTFLENFIKVCIDQYMSKQKVCKRFVYQNMNGQWEKIAEQSERMADTIVLKDHDKETLIEELEHFLHNKEWYINHGFLYSIGILLYGSPGTGKTSLIRYISSVSKRNTHYLRLSQIHTEQEFNILLKSVNLAETVLVMEDIDCAGTMVHNREKVYNQLQEIENNEADMNERRPIKIIIDNSRDTNRDLLKMNDRVTLDVLLNILDGTLTTPGQIIVMTTNHKDILDNALIRPGRIDINLELVNCNHDMINRLCKTFYKKDKLSDEINEMITIIPEYSYSPAHIMNIFRKNKSDITQGIKDIHQLVSLPQ